MAAKLDAQRFRRATGATIAPGKLIRKVVDS